jgi:hypothetical protein
MKKPPLRLNARQFRVGPGLGQGRIGDLGDRTARRLGSPQWQIFHGWVTG